MRKQTTAKKGVVLMISVLMMMFIVLPAVGLAIDGAVLYTIRSRLQSATDGAAIAAARSLARGMNPSQQQQSAIDTAVKYFNGNLTSTWPGLNPPGPVVTFPPASTPRTVRVAISTQVDAPTYFMKVLHKNSVRITASAEAVRREVNIMMVLDRSKSLENSGWCDDLREAAKSFVDGFVDGRDRIGMVTFGTTYRVDMAPTYNFKSNANPNNLQYMINSIRCVGGTNSAAAFWTGYQQLVNLNEQGVLNVVLFFTDGKPNTLHLTNLDVKSTSYCTDKSAKTGVIAPTSGGTVWGIMKWAEPTAPPAADPDTVVIAGSGGCSYASNFGNVKNDIGALARSGAANEVDVFGNSLTGYKTPINRVSSGTYAGRIRIDDAETVTNAGINALASAASRARADSQTRGLDFVTFAIAIGTPESVEETLLQRVANVPEAGAAYDNTKPKGMYVRADNPSQLDEAFSQLASEVMRFSK